MGEAQITRVGNENKFFIKTMTVSEKSMETETMEDHEKVARTIKRALLSETARRDADAGKLDLNNSAEGEIARFLRSKGLSEEDAAESARIIIDRRKTATGIIGDSWTRWETAGLKHRVISLLSGVLFPGRIFVAERGDRRSAGRERPAPESDPGLHLGPDRHAGLHRFPL